MGICFSSKKPTSDDNNKKKIISNTAAAKVSRASRPTGDVVDAGVSSNIAKKPTSDDNNRKKINAAADKVSRASPLAAAGAVNSGESFNALMIMSAVAGNQEVGGGCDGGGQHHHQGGYSHHHRHHGGGCGGGNIYGSGALNLVFDLRL
ncbi:hypothetical protein QL285_029970 [Trifolium repens]|nr:hypothetical protein QL285_029970 [Trifolium repens]